MVSATMLRHSFSSLILLGLTSLASGSVLYARGKDVAVGGKWKNHDQITAFQQQASDGVEGEIELRFKPGLNDASGCFPYAAVDKDGFHGYVCNELFCQHIANDVETDFSTNLARD